MLPLLPLLGRRGKKEHQHKAHSVSSIFVILLRTPMDPQCVFIDWRIIAVASGTWSTTCFLPATTRLLLRRFEVRTGRADTLPILPTLPVFFQRAVKGRRQRCHHAPQPTLTVAAPGWRCSLCSQGLLTHSPVLGALRPHHQAWAPGHILQPHIWLPLRWYPLIQQKCSPAG